MSEFDSELYVRVAFFAFLIPLGSGEFSIICNQSIRVKNSANSQIFFWQTSSVDVQVFDVYS